MAVAGPRFFQSFSILPRPELPSPRPPTFLHEPESFVEPDSVHIVGGNRQPHLFDQRISRGPVEQSLQDCRSDSLTPPVFADGDGQAAAMGNTTVRTIVEAQAADHRPQNLGRKTRVSTRPLFLNFQAAARLNFLSKGTWKPVRMCSHRISLDEDADMFGRR